MLYRLLILLVSGSALLGAHASGSPSGLHETVASHRVFSAYDPDQIASAYDFAPLAEQGIDGTGQTVALLELGSANPSDIATFDRTYNLPAPAIRQFYAGGRAFRLFRSQEAALDVEWLHALAPGAAIQIYYINRNQPMSVAWGAMAHALSSAAGRGASIISISLGACRAGPGSRAVTAALANLIRRDVSVFVSSGDSGDHPGSTRDCGSGLGVAYPASDPNVVAVGGTSLHLNPDGSIAGEVAWKLSGGGVVTSLQRASWEHATTMPRDTHRWAPDVAFVGDPRTGVNYFANGGWHQAGGTSLGAPTWAAAWALVRENADQWGEQVHPASRLLYRIGHSPEYHQAFHDITLGSNGTYHAGPGWDAVTGWGTPDVAAIAQIVQDWSPAS